MKQITQILFLLLFAINLSSHGQCWNLVWSDEFNGTTLDQTKWAYLTGTGCPNLCGWGNNELEYYTNITDNVFESGGTLKIKANYSANYLGSGKNYTSGKIITQGKASWQYGRFDASIKLPSATGVWPAFWLLPLSGNWPADGEIDVIETSNKNPTVLNSTLHYGTSSSPQYTGISYNTSDLSAAFHKYSLVWKQDTIKFYLDDKLYYTLNSSKTVGKVWPFNKQAFYIILNVAVGGNYPGKSPISTEYPTQMEIDYVRVYTNGVCTTDVNEIDTKQVQFNVYPNPFTDGFTINSTNVDKPVNILIFDYAGKLVYKNEHQAMNSSVNIGNNLSAGIYIVKIIGEDFVKQLKIMKK